MHVSCARCFSSAGAAVAFTICQVPVVLARAEAPEVRVVFSDAAVRTIPGQELDVDTSAEIFGRTGRVQHLEVRGSRGRGRAGSVSEGWLARLPVEPPEGR